MKENAKFYREEPYRVVDAQTGEVLIKFSYDTPNWVIKEEVQKLVDKRDTSVIVEVLETYIVPKQIIYPSKKSSAFHLKQAKAIALSAKEWEGNGEGDTKSIYKADAKQIRKLACLVRDKEIRKAVTYARRLDTVVREVIPEDVYDWLLDQGETK